MVEILRYLGTLTGGLFLLYIGGEGLIKGASNFAIRIGIKPIIIGLTVVAFGTSMPEAVVSLLASIQANPDMAVSNVVGSNIFNIGFILGLSAMIRPLRVEQGSIKREIPFVIASAILLMALGADGKLGRMDGFILLATLSLFILICFRDTINKSAFTKIESKDGHFKNSAFIIGGFVALIFGAKFFVSGAVDIAKIMGVSDLIIGLTIVSAGTSLPELMASTLSAYRGKDDLAVGNVTGSNIFNILFILGFCALILPLTISSEMMGRDIPFLLAVSILCLPLMKTGFRINRYEGAFLMVCYMGYLGWILRPYIHN